MNQDLQPDSILQGGKYRIVRSLGQGGFGITYLAIQSGLERKVAVKEFFMKDFCWRDSATRQVMLSTEGHRELVSRYHAKFLKEARRTAQFVHPHIVRIIDVFQENYTAYYVMEFAGRGSLQDKVEREGALPEAEATRYILQVASALDYVHRQKVNHLDVKPGNIMLNDQDEAVLIDFGLAKQYEASTGGQTSTTPIGYSHGYAPSEQYRDGGVSKFSPETDIYSLGATFFFLLTGQRPPSASDVIEDGVPVDVLKAKRVSPSAIAAICRAMKERRKDRYSQVRDFMEALRGDVPSVSPASQPVSRVATPRVSKESDDTLPIYNEKQRRAEREAKPKAKQQKVEYGTMPSKVPSKIWIGVAVGVIALFGVLVGLSKCSGSETASSVIEKKAFTLEGVTFNMVKVDGGTFTMGATSEMSEPLNEEMPAHEVTLSSYSIGETEVTQALWQAVMGSNPSEFKGDNLPVEQVSWDDCQEFIRKLNTLTGQRFRLPTEAEWEFAARGGNRSNHTQYSGSSDLDEVAWYYNNSGDGYLTGKWDINKQTKNHCRTHPVKTKKANELGLYDMSGNVWEWCQDRYGSYSSSSQSNPEGPSSGSYRVLRGGSWNDVPSICRSSYRTYSAPDYRYINRGLRLALSE